MLEGGKEELRPWACHGRWAAGITALHQGWVVGLRCGWRRWVQAAALTQWSLAFCRCLSRWPMLAAGGQSWGHPKYRLSMPQGCTICRSLWLHRDFSHGDKEEKQEGA